MAWVPSAVEMISRVDSDVIRLGHEQARAGPWHGDPRLAYFVPLPGGPAPSPAFVRLAMADLAARGFSRVVTNALSPTEQPAFLGAGFEVQERLHLLAHDLRRLPARPPPPVATRHRRAEPTDRRAVLELDACAFPAFWRLDDGGLDDALRATPRVRFRLVTSGRDLVAYALTGRAGRRGFLQRLAVHPAHRRHGLGRFLVVDALRWLRRWGAVRAIVNTPTGNAAAVGLYEGVGFRREPHGLAVLTAAVSADVEDRPWARADRTLRP